MSMGGSLAGPVTAYIYNWNMLPIGQLLWEKELMSYKEFPPLQAPETYNLDAILKMVQTKSAKAISCMSDVSGRISPCMKRVSSCDGVGTFLRLEARPVHGSDVSLAQRYVESLMYLIF